MSRETKISISNYIYRMIAREARIEYTSEMIWKALKSGETCERIQENRPFTDFGRSVLLI